MPKKIVTAVAAAAVIPLALVLSQATQAVASAPRSASADAFLPSRHGLAFINPSPRPGENRIARAVVGRCGGMAFAALDAYRRGEKPAMKTASDAYITMRNLTSVLDNAPRFVAWSVSPDSEAWWRGGSVGQLTREQELPRITRALAVSPAPIGLTRARSLDEISRNHQMVAYAIEQSEEIARIHVYDPNFPAADDVVLQVDLQDSSAPVLQLRGEFVVAEWTGLFLARYASPIIEPRS